MVNVMVNIVYINMTINYDISIMLYNDKQAHVGDMFVGILWGYKPGTVNRDLLSKKNWIPIMGLQPCGRNVWDGLKWCIGAIWYETGDQVMWISSVNQQVDVEKPCADDVPNGIHHGVFHIYSMPYAIKLGIE